MPLFQKILGADVLQNTYYISTSVCLLLIITICLFKKLKCKNEFLSQEIPGLKLYWFDLIGHGLIILRQAWFHRKYSMNTYILQTLEGMRMLFKNDSMFHIWLFNTPYIFLCKADAIGSVNKNFVTHVLTIDLCFRVSSDAAISLIVKYENVSSYCGFSTGSKWKPRRKILNPSFHLDTLKGFLPVFNERATVLIDILSEATCEEWIDITKPLKMCNLDIIYESMFGIKANAQKEQDSEIVKRSTRSNATTMERMLNPIMAIDFIFHLSKTGKQYMQDIEFLDNLTKKIFRKKKEQFKINEESGENGVQRKRKAFMDILLHHYMHKQDFTEEDIIEEVNTFLLAGFDTTSAALCWCLYLVGLHPEVQKKIHDELDTIFDDDHRHITVDDLVDMPYLDCVIKEGLRLFPSAPLIARKLTSDSMIGGRLIKSGTECAVFIYGLHRDADVFPNPEVFDPERFSSENSAGRKPYVYVPFSAGFRNCIGQRFAMMELKVVLGSVFRQFSILSLEQRDKVVPADNISIEPNGKIKVKVMPRKENRE